MLSEERDQVTQLSAGTGRIFDIISTIYFCVDTIRNSISAQQKIILCLSGLTGESGFYKLTPSFPLSNLNQLQQTGQHEA